MILETGTSVVWRADGKEAKVGAGLSGGLVWNVAEGKAGGNLRSGWGQGL